MMENIAKSNILQFIKNVKDMIYNLTFNDSTSFIRSSISSKNPEIFTIAKFEEIVTSTLSILIKVYGEKNNHITEFVEKGNSYRRYISDKHQLVLSLCLGKLNAVENDLNYGLIEALEKEITGEVFGDLIKTSKSSIEQGYKEVAAVLCCAALEDILKKLARNNDIEVEDRTMNVVINSLKGKGLIKGAQTSIIGSYVTLRNKAFHAEWEKFEIADVKGLIAFTEEFLIKHFT